MSDWVKTSGCARLLPSLPRFSCLLCIHSARVRACASLAVPICGFLGDAFWTNFGRKESNFAEGVKQNGTRVSPPDHPIPICGSDHLP